MNWKNQVTLLDMRWWQEFENRDTVINIWTSASIPILTPEGITYKINKIIDRYISLKKLYKRGQKRPKYMAEVEKYTSHLNTFLDISACKCDNFKLS